MIKVFHNSKFLEDGFNNTVTGVLKLVAEVDTDDLEEAYMLTNNIDSSWTKNSKVKNLQKNSQRSSSMGDVFKLNEEFHMVALCGFKQLATMVEYNDEIYFLSDGNFKKVTL